MKSAGGEGWSNAADRRGDVEQILLVRRSLPENDGGEGIPWKPVRWTERFPLQVTTYMPKGSKLLKPYCHIVTCVQGRWFSAVGRLAPLCRGGCSGCLSLWTGWLNYIGVVFTNLHPTGNYRGRETFRVSCKPCQSWWGQHSWLPFNTWQ